MNALAARWTQWRARYAALTQRERVVVAAALVFGGGFLIYNFAIDPFVVRARSASRVELAARTELAQQRALVAVLTAQNADPDAANRNRLAKAKQELSAVSGRLARFEANMVPPARMPAFLAELLAKNRAIEMLGLKTLPVTLVGIPAAPAKTEAAASQGAKEAGKDQPAQSAAASAAAEGIYQHGIEIRLAGSYNDLLNYLAELERMPQRVMWNSVSLTVEKYPRNVMVLRLYTLSLDKNWLLV